MVDDCIIRRLATRPSTELVPHTAGRGVFRKQFPFIEFTPAPTDYHATQKQSPTPWYHELTALVPTPSHLVVFSDVMHEYLGLGYYKLRGWM